MKDVNETLDQVTPQLKITAHTTHAAALSAIRNHVVNCGDQAVGTRAISARSAAHERIDANAIATLVPSSATKGLLHQLCCNQLTRETSRFNQQTTGLPLHLPARPNDICCEGQTARDRWLLCVASLPQNHPVSSHAICWLCRWPIDVLPRLA